MKSRHANFSVARREDISTHTHSHLPIQKHTYTSSVSCRRVKRRGPQIIIIRALKCAASKIEFYTQPDDAVRHDEEEEEESWDSQGSRQESDKFLTAYLVLPTTMLLGCEQRIVYKVSRFGFQKMRQCRLAVENLFF
jgi:hypothetical protein